MAKYQQYEQYKDAQDSWLSLIPNKWEVVPLKFLCLNPVKDGPHETPVFIDDGIPFLSVDGIQNNQLVFNGCRYISGKDHEKYSKKCAPVHGDILLGKAASVGKVAYVDTSIEFNVWSPLAVITPKDARLGKYIFYAFQSTMLQAQCEVYSNSNTQKNLGMNTIDNLHLPCPSYKEAEKIANFLDYETAQIDTLIEKQQTLIQLLKEKRQAVISHAVTKGLKPDAPMKDSGVEWLGEVPEHWEVCRIKDLSNIISKGTTPSTMGGELIDKGVRFLKAENIGKSEYVKLTPEFYISEQVNDQLARSKLEENDVLVIIAGATTGMASILQKELLPCNTNQAVSFIRPKNSTYSKWIARWLSTEFSQRIIWMGAVQAAQPNLSMEDLGNIPITLPIDTEVTAIMNFIDNNLRDFDSLILKAEQAIQLMQERRTALISAAVTGKIDVRGWRAAE